jgi:hypothetical protein
LTVLDQIGREAEGSQRDVEGTLGEFGEAFGSLFESWAPRLEEMATEQQRKDEEIALRIADLLVDSVSIDGISIREMAGNPEDWYLYRKNMARKMMTNRGASKTMQQVVAEANDANQDPTFVHVTIDIPTMEAIDQFMSELDFTSQQLERDFESIFNTYAQ